MSMAVKVRDYGVVWQHVDDELIVLDETRSTYLKVVGAGNALWPLVVEGTTLDALTGELRVRFGIDEAIAKADAQAFIDDLASNDLLEDKS